jgi:hypothetical protein
VQEFDGETDDEGIYDAPNARENANWGLTAGPSGWACDEINKQVNVSVGGEAFDFVCDL